MKVFKFGGASIKDADAVRNVKTIISEYSDKRNLLVVVSAMGKSTNGLEAILEAYHKGDDYKPLIEEMRNFHLDISRELFNNQEATIFKQLDQLFFLLEKKLTSGIEDKDELYDQIVSFGELISSHIISAYLNQEDVPTQFIDARIYIQTSETWREGQVDYDWTEQMIKAELPAILDKQVILTQGFIGGTISNRTTTLGREGSDFSAAIFAHCLDADGLTIWKDVPGIMNADPKRVPDATLYDKLSYKYAAEMTYYGASVIHPKTIRPLAVKGIPLYVKSFVHPSDPGTVIGDVEMKDNTKTAYIFKKNQCLMRFEEKDFLNVNKAHLGVVFNELSRYNIKLNLTRNSALSFTICVDYNESNIQRVINVLSDHFYISTLNHLELITVRNYTDEAIKGLGIDPATILIEQRTDDNYQVVKKAD
ncbi:aspartate kinase [Limibacter armeniacum]|uniref:aspartate kinase n=1 Tax=Limibacter armeniacum TaxID=466084 RepID=UPI002FE50F06